jgi:hypothetical protein
VSPAGDHTAICSQVRPRPGCAAILHIYNSLVLGEFVSWKSRVGTHRLRPVGQTKLRGSLEQQRLLNVDSSSPCKLNRRHTWPHAGRQVGEGEGDPEPRSSLVLTRLGTSMARKPTGKPSFMPQRHFPRFNAAKPFGGEGSRKRNVQGRKNPFAACEEFCSHSVPNLFGEGTLWLRSVHAE